MRGATKHARAVALRCVDFNPRSPCGERHYHFINVNERFPISIHAPRAGSDNPAKAGFLFIHYFNPRSPCGERHFFFGVVPASGEFQSTLPVRGATFSNFIAFIFCYISIHAPRAGSDCRKFARFCHANNFNPRSPCGERPYSASPIVITGLFQSTLPVRGATLYTINLVASRLSFQSTLPVRGATRTAFPGTSYPFYFNPRSPCGERPGCTTISHAPESISIHAPRAGSDRFRRKQLQHFRYFNPRSPCGERPRSRGIYHELVLFQSTLPVRGATVAD